jgi:hypothetical protein
MLQLVVDIGYYRDRLLSCITDKTILFKRHRVFQILFYDNASGDVFYMNSAVYLCNVDITVPLLREHKCICAVQHRTQTYTRFQFYFYFFLSHQR